jgi:hypothetical protein
MCNPSETNLAATLIIVAVTYTTFSCKLKLTALIRDNIQILKIFSLSEYHTYHEKSLGHTSTYVLLPIKNQLIQS